LTEGAPVRSVKQLFERTLQLEAPWRVLATDFDFERQRVEPRLGFRAGSRFRCPRCERMCEAFDFTEGTWRQPDAMALETFVTAPLPRIRCPEHGDLALTPFWATDHVSVRALIREERAGQLGRASTQVTPRGGRPPANPRRARR
jgi:hypothetical protein